MKYCEEDENRYPLLTQSTEKNHMDRTHTAQIRDKHHSKCPGIGQRMRKRRRPKTKWHRTVDIEAKDEGKTRRDNDVTKQPLLQSCVP